MLYYLRCAALFIVLAALAVVPSGYAKGTTSEGVVNIPDANLRVLIDIALDKPDGAAITTDGGAKLRRHIYVDCH